MLNAVEVGFGLGGALGGGLLDDTSGNGGGVVQFDGGSRFFQLVGLGGVAGVAVAEEGAGTEGGDGDHQGGDDCVLIHAHTPGPQAA